MKRALTKSSCAVWWVDNSVRREGYPPGVYGDMSGVYGDLSGVYGNLTNVCGDLGHCDLTEDDRRNGVDVADLIKQTA